MGAQSKNTDLGRLGPDVPGVTICGNDIVLENLEMIKSEQPSENFSSLPN